MSLALAESIAWWFGIATLLSLMCLALLTSFLPQLEAKYEKAAWYMDVAFAWITVALFFATFYFSTIVSERQDERINPRQITAKQAADFGEATAEVQKGYIEVLTVTQDSETMQFADTIRRMLESAGFMHQGGVHELVGSTYPLSGVTIVENVSDNDAPILLRAYLNKAGIDAVIYPDSSLSLGSLKLVVGGK